jgi:NitT/TauT family transport system permease protein
MGNDLMNKKVLPWILPIIVLIFWYIITVPIQLVPNFVLPTPYMVVQSGYELIMNGQLLDDTVSSLIKVFSGLILGAVVAIPLGVVLGWSERLESMSSVIVGVLRPIPPVAWIPFSILWFGIGLVPGIFLIFMGCVFPILISTIDGVKRTDKVLIEAGQTLGTSNLQSLTKVVFPSAIPAIVSGLKVAVGIALMCTIAAEMVASNNGIGHLIITASNLFDTGAIIIGMLVIGIIGLIFDLVFRKVQKRIFW